MPIRNILVATDFSADAEAALEHALELAQLLGAKLHVLHSYHIAIQTTPTGFLALSQEVVESARAEAQARLEALAQPLEQSGVAVQLHASSLEPVGAILELAAALPADLIAMGTRGLTGLKHVLFGSVAERAVRLAPCPVLTVKSPAV
jgi:universal stress protein A